MASDRGRLLALQLVFALNAVGLAVWFPRIPDVKAALGLDVLQLSFALFGLPAGTMVGFFAVGRLTRRIGLKATCILGGAAFLISFIGPALATSLPLLTLALFVCGLTIASIEVAMNAKASQMERVLGRRIMTRCHAFWSFGAVTGALLGGGFAQAGISFVTQQIVLQPLFAALSIHFARQLIDDAPSEPDAPVSAPRRFTWPDRSLLMLCIVPIGALMIEGAMMEWSALLLRGHLGAEPFAAGMTFAIFALAMALTRFAGDALAEKFGPATVMIASGLLMMAGFATFGLSPHLAISVPAAVLTGIGCANIYPLAMSMVGRLPGRRTETNVTTLALIAFVAFLIGPPLIGLMANLFGLPPALAVLAPLGLLPALILGRRGPVTAPPTRGSGRDQPQ